MGASGSVVMQSVRGLESDSTQSYGGAHASRAVRNGMSGIKMLSKVDENDECS